MRQPRLRDSHRADTRPVNWATWEQIAVDSPIAMTRSRPLAVGLLLPDHEGHFGGATARWRDLREMARLAEAIGVDSLWVTDHLINVKPHRPNRGTWECWSLLVGAGRGHGARRAGHARRLHRLPQPGAAGQDGRHRRGDQRWPAHPRPRRRLERGGVPRLRLPLRPPRQPLRGGADDHPLACSATGRSTSRASTTRRATASCGRAARAPRGHPS